MDLSKNQIGRPLNRPPFLCFTGYGRAPGLLHVPFHDEAGLKNDDFLGGHWHFLSGAGVASEASAPGLDLEYPEIPQLDGLASG